ncbi:hypothetical protein EYF80_021663 [Liparis tanakae]|uniref:Uncharacterized protein n=1 Tax=Liparis tanakae TaxID=230148 RepID=A0A4Z2HRD4_9TELE|nr:hypothetical protein EYF80_021663 [Liparis tanakae]
MSRDGSVKSSSKNSKEALVLKEASSCWADVPAEREHRHLGWPQRVQGEGGIYFQAIVPPFDEEGRPRFPAGQRPRGSETESNPLPPGPRRPPPTQQGGWWACSAFLACSIRHSHVASSTSFVTNVYGNLRAERSEGVQSENTPPFMLSAVWDRRELFSQTPEGAQIQSDTGKKP